MGRCFFWWEPERVLGKMMLEAALRWCAGAEQLE